MECPNCRKEPIKVFSRWTEGVSFRSYLKGYVKCIHCGTLLKRSWGRAFWFSLGLFLVFFFFLYGSIYFNLLEFIPWPGKTILGASIVMLISAISTGYASVLAQKFRVVDTDE